MTEIISKLVPAETVVAAQMTAKSVTMATTIRNHFLKGEYC